MATEEEMNNLSDEDFLAAIDEAVMADGTGEVTESNDDELNENEDNTGSDKEDDNEDTDQHDTGDDSAADDTDTKGQDADPDNDTGDDADDEGEKNVEENAQVENDGSKDDESDKSDATEKSEEDAKDKKDDKSEDGADTDETGDGESKDTDTVDYKKQYDTLLKEKDKLQGFYDIATSEFTANGKKMKGFTDPQKIVQAQQMAAGFSDKMAGFKQYRPYMAPLKDRGMLEDQSKFDMMMSIMDGDKEALKQHIKNLELDPIVDLDTEDIKYDRKSQVSSNVDISFDEVIDNATAHGVKKEVEDILLGGQWDRESVIELLKDSKSSSDIVEHVSNGAYEQVQTKIAEMKRTDANGVYSSQNSITQYRQAANALEQDYISSEKDRIAQDAADKANAKVEAEKARIEKERSDAKYKAQVEQKNKEAAEARAKASSVSKSKTTGRPKGSKNFDPMKMSDDELTKMVDGFMYS